MIYYSLLPFLVFQISANLLPYRTVTDPTSTFYHDPPRLDCTPDGIQLFVKPIGNFSGHIYAKGFFFSDTCHSSFVDSPTSTPVLLNIPYRGDCNVRRHHTSNPPAVSYGVTVVVQRHPLLVTAGDRAYRLSCVYRQLDTHVSQQIDVNDLTTMPVQESSKGPTCHYDVLAKTLEGVPIRFANVGDSVVHRWSCDTDLSGFLVHSCLVRNEAGDEYRLVDERGCVIDSELVPDLVYNDNLSLVYTNMKAFKFADQVMVHFSCSITLCRKSEQGCEGIAPPTCNQRDLKPIPVQYRTTETTTTDWQKVISDSLQELEQPEAGDESSFPSPLPSTGDFSRAAVHVTPQTSHNYQEATTLPFDSSRFTGNGIMESATEQSSKNPSAWSPGTAQEEDKDNYGLEIVDATNLEKESGSLPKSWIDMGEGYQTRMLSSPLRGLPEDDPLPSPEAANVYYGSRRPRSKDGQEGLTVEVEAAEMAVFTADSPVSQGSQSQVDSDPVGLVVAEKLSTLQTSILSLALVSEVALVVVICLQKHFYRRSIRRLKDKQGMPDY